MIGDSRDTRCEGLFGRIDRSYIGMNLNEGLETIQGDERKDSAATQRKNEIMTN